MTPASGKFSQWGRLPALSNMPFFELRGPGEADADA